MREGELNPARGALKPADHVRYGAHNGLKSDIALCPFSAISGSPLEQNTMPRFDRVRHHPAHSGLFADTFGLEI